MLFQRLQASAVGGAVAILGFLPILAANEGAGDGPRVEHFYPGGVIGLYSADRNSNSPQRVGTGAARGVT